jgi:hypothetical protein
VTIYERFADLLDKLAVVLCKGSEHLQAKGLISHAFLPHPSQSQANLRGDRDRAIACLALESAIFDEHTQLGKCAELFLQYRSAGLFLHGHTAATCA